MYVKNIVVRTPNWIGDFVLFIPALKALQSRFSTGNLTLVMHNRVGELARMVEGVDRVLLFDGSIRAGWIRGFVRFSRQTSRDPIDLYVVFPLSFSSAAMSYLSGARRRLGYSTEGRGVLLTERVRLPEDYRRRHLSKSYIRLVAEVGANEPPVEPRLNVPNVCDSADRILENTGSDGGAIGIAPYAAYGPAKRWPMEKFMQLASTLHKKHGRKVFVFGSAEDSASNAGLREGDAEVLDLSGRLTLVEAAYVLKKCSCLVSNDTGIAHVASAVGTPVISIFGSTDPRWTSPIGAKNAVVYKQMDCSPCFDRECRLGHYGCLHGVSVNEVSEAVGEVLG